MSPVSIHPARFSHEPDTPDTPSATAATAVTWSEFQEAVFEFCTGQSGSAQVCAVAGSGKTSTIVEAARRLMSSPAARAKHFSVAFVAFNKSIAEELKTRLPEGVKAQTLNAMGYGAWRRKLGDAGHLQLDTGKTRTLVQGVIPPHHLGDYSKGMTRLIGLAKSAGLVPCAGPHWNVELDDDVRSPLLPADPERYTGLVEDDDEWWQDTVDVYNLDVEADLDKAAVRRQFLTYARTVLVLSILQGHRLIDFDDQLYLPVITGASFWQNDVMFVDEAQDLNHIQRVMLRRALKRNGRLIAVGDENQSIYLFRGASCDAMGLIEQDFATIPLPLTITYRCPKAVVNEAHRWVSHIEAAETAPEGCVRNMGTFTSTTFHTSDAIICRNTRPLIDLAFNLLRDGVPCKVQGRDIGQGLITLIKRFKVTDLAIFSERLHTYVEDKCQAWLLSGKDALADRLTDQADTIHVFLDQLEIEAGSVRYTVDDLVHKIESMFHDNGAGTVLLSTIHRAKGREWERVFILDPDLMPSRYARTPEAKQQEANLQYVAVTRAKQELVYIQSGNFKPKAEVANG